MNLKKISIELSIDDVKQVIRIALDDDKDQALAFIKKNLFKQLEKALQPH